MNGLSKILYRFRGYILAVLAIALCAMPAATFPPHTASTTDSAIFETPAAIAATFAAIALCLAGILLRIRTRQFIGEHTRGSKHEAECLVVDGPYAYTRHPLYLSNTIIAISAILFHLGFSLTAVPFAFAVIAFEVYLARTENRFLQAKFGDRWLQWTPGLRYARQRRNSANAGPKRPFSRAFCADWATWTWLLLYYLLLLAKKVFMS
jgi:protein-S-isoprenylcysteine O-methyltransferase Ste14